jgi:hypothetical protein
MRGQFIPDDNTNGGVGCLTLLFLIFLVLKLTGLIAWSWWWVTLPLWGPAIPFLLVILWVICARIVSGRVFK